MKGNKNGAKYNIDDVRNIRELHEKKIILDIQRYLISQVFQDIQYI